MLFDKSRAGGFVLTPEGQRLLSYADAMETTVQSASDQFTSGAQTLSGHVRIGSTEGFGCFVLAPQLARFTDRHPDVSIDLLPVPHFVSLLNGKRTWPSRSSAPSAANTSIRSCATTGSDCTVHATIWSATSTSVPWPICGAMRSSTT